MRVHIVLVLSSVLFACNGSTTPVDTGTGQDVASTPDATNPADTVATNDVPASDGNSGMDAHVITLHSNNGQLDCYGAATCMTSGATPLCCDEKLDGGFIDMCVATTAACSGMDSKTIACTDPSDCSNGMVCCGTFGMAASGSTFFGGSVCAATCPTSATQNQLCITSADCASGMCVAASVSAIDLGRCM